jgi:hypothetical protein
MKSALSLTLTVCLVGSAMPLAGQERLGPTSGPIARAVTREAIRLAAASAEAGTSELEAVQQAGKPVQADWSRVRKLAPGTEVIVIVQGSRPGTRYVVLADESELTVINLTAPELPSPSTSANAARCVNERLEMSVPHSRVSLVGKPTALTRGGHFE